MLALDIRTLVIILIVVMIGSAVTLLGFWQSQRQLQSIKFWALGVSFAAAGLVLISLRGILPQFISIIIGNLVTLAGFLLLLRGYIAFTNRRSFITFEITLLSVITLLFLYFTYIDFNLSARVISTSIAQALICLSVVIILVKEKGAVWHNAGFSAGIINLVYAGFMSYRAIYTYLVEPRFDLMGGTNIDAYSFVLLIFYVGGSTFCFIWMSFAALEGEWRILSRAVEQSSSSILITDTDGNIEYINPAFTRKTGYLAKEVIGQNPRFLKSGLTPDESYRRMWEIITSGETWHGEFQNRTKKGELMWEAASVAPVKQANNKITHFVGIQEDITRQKKAEEELKFLANHDSLTKLPTRRLLNEHLVQAQKIAKRKGSKIAVMFIDLDGFKAVNDNLGHDAGDTLLQMVAEKINYCIRESDQVARIGGDEFIIVLPDVETVEGVGTVAQKIIDELNLPFAISGSEAVIGASIGIAFYPDHGKTSEELLKHADDAMYEAKRAGKNKFVYAVAT